jgi:outer membrane lipoprotein SlyB
MGVIGGAIGSEGGSALGGLLGKRLGGRAGASAGKNIGRVAGGVMGGILPFKTGGKVKKTGLALVHKNEFVLPANAKPTKAQRAVVAKNKKKAKK